MPIGIFDSGLGGLTVAAEVRKLLPKEDIIYFGDTGRVPYGNRGRDVIRRYAGEDADFLLSKGVKLIIAACGTVSSVAPDIGGKLPVPFVGVVEPASISAVRATKNRRIGVAGTAATVSSGSFVKAIGRIDPNISVFTKACPLFVNIVEEGYFSKGDPLPALVTERYIEPLKAAEIDTLILGCTHFPMLSEVISDYMGEGVTLVNAGEETAKTAKAALEADGLLNEKEVPGKTEFFVSDRPEGFSYGAGRYSRVRSSIRFSVAVTVGYAAVFWAAAMLFPGLLIRVFNSEPEVVAAGIPALRIYFCLFIPMSLQMAGQGVFVSLGRSKQAVFFSLLRKAIINAPLTVVLPIWMGTTGVFTAEAISQLVGGLACSLTMYFTVYRPLGRLPDRPPENI